MFAVSGIKRYRYYGPQDKKGKNTMIACFAWTNLQLINISNAKVNLYKDEKADLFIRMGPHISADLVDAIRTSNIYDHVYSFDPVVLNYKNMTLGWIPGFKVFLLKSHFQKAYNVLMDNLCGSKVYHRALVTWFYAENVFVLNYWKKYSHNLAITLVEEGTGTYFYSKNDLAFPMFMGKHIKDRIRRKVTEGPLAAVLKKKIDSICMYRPEYSHPDIDYHKLRLPVISEIYNPVVHNLLHIATQSILNQKLDRYNAATAIYFSLFSQEGSAYDATSLQILNTLINEMPTDCVVAKIHTGDPIHAETFAKEIENRAYIDRDVYIFEGVYAQMNGRREKLLVSCLSSATINPKFMFGDEPYVIFTYRLYNDYQRRPIKGDDWIANALIDAYEDKSRVMIPNTIQDLENAIRSFISREN